MTETSQVNRKPVTITIRPMPLGLIRAGEQLMVRLSQTSEAVKVVK